MRIAVVIPALDEAERVVRAVSSARAPGVDVVVVDGGSRDATAERARAAGARVVSSPPGRAAQLEAGRRAADGDAVLFLHADSELPAGYADAIRTALSDPAVVGGAFGLRFDRRTWGLRFIEWGVRVRVALFALPYGDQGLFARTSVLEDMGGVPQVRLMEDLDLVRALQRRGRFVVLPEAVVTSARRYVAGGVVRTWLAHAFAAAAWRLGVDRTRIARWLGR